MLKQGIQGVLLLASTFLILCCGAPSVLLVDGVRVEQPSQGRDPEIISLPLPVSAAVDSLKLDLIHRGFTIKESDNRLGIIQTDDKILAKDEDFGFEYSPEQKAATAGGCLAAAVVVGCVAAVVACNSHDNKNNDNHCDASKNHHEDNYVSETKPDVVQSKGRLQIIASRDNDSTHTTLELSAYLSTYTNGVKGSEDNAIRLHPFVQKYACLLSHKNCGRAPGQKIIPDSSVWGGP